MRPYSAPGGRRNRPVPPTPSSRPPPPPPSRPFASSFESGLRSPPPAPPTPFGFSYHDTTTYAATSSIGSMGEGSPLEKELKMFFKLRDQKCERIVGDLFRLYYFTDIAKGINRKYRVLPEGWKPELEKLKAEGDPNLDWLNISEVKWYNEVTQNYPGIDEKVPKVQRGPSQEHEKVIDEFIENEKNYFAKVDEFVKYYLWEVEAIAENRLGPKAQEYLGLSQNQVDYAFGKLKLVHQSVEELLVSLEVLSLVDAPSKHPAGRAGYFAETLEVQGERSKKAYGEYNARYQLSKRMLEVMGEQVPEHMLGHGEIMKHLNFKELWYEVSSTRETLKSLGIDTVLIAPVRRYPNYGLFVSSVKKKLPTDHPATEAIERCHIKITEYTRYIDDQVSLKSESESEAFKRLTRDV